MEKISKSPFDLFDAYRSSQKLATLVANVLVVLMMGTVGIGFAQLGERLSPGWRGFYLFALAIFISVESIATRKRTRELEGRERLIFHVSEWIAFAVGIKILLYLIHDPGQLFADLPRWQENFVENFFTGEYLLALFVTLIVWIVSRMYAGEVEALNERELDAEWEELGKLQNALNDIRRRLAARIFIVGTVVVGLAVLARIDASSLLRNLGQPTPGYNAPIANVLAYFICALVLLSQSQFALLRTRWRSQRLPISPQLPRNWLRYGLLFFAALAVIVFFLPTDYSIGLLDTLRYFFEYLIQAVTFLMVLFTLPFTFCLSLFNLGSEPRSTERQPDLSPPMIPATPNQPIAWLEFVKSLAFWVIFLGIVFFALRYYLSQNATLWQAITHFPFFRWLREGWEAFRNWLRGANQQLAGMVRGGLKRLRQQQVKLPTASFRRMINFARLTPRERIIYLYLNLVQLGGERGLERRPGQTPYQYEQRLENTLPEVNQELRGLTDTFVEARYSRHHLDQPEAERAGNLWERIKAVLRSWKDTHD